MKSQNPKDTIDFGYQQVETHQKAERVYQVFSSVASKYDIMNDMMSAGLHRLWKDRFVQQLKLQNDMRVLDLAGGTGDISLRILRRAEKQGVRLHITVSDINENMLQEGRKRALNKGIIHPLSWEVINAEEIPYEDNSLDAVTIAFGIRNVTDKDKALREICRVLKPSGQFLCLEFSQVNNPLLQAAYDAYSFNIIPQIGALVAGERDSYQYLVESIRKFPTREAFRKAMEKAGFVSTSYRALQQGVVAIHEGWKA